MIDWETIRPVLVEVIADVSGLNTIWIDKKRPYVDPKEQAVVYLRVRSSKSEGDDDRRRTYDLAKSGQEVTFTQQGPRNVGIEIRVESFRQDDDRFAFNAAEKVRTAMCFRSVLARLRAVNCALIDVMDVNDVASVMQDQRVVSVAMFEISVRMIGSADDVEKTTYIEKVAAPQGTLT